MKLYYVTDREVSTPLALVPTMKEAVKYRSGDGGPVDIETVELSPTRQGICDFVNDQFGLWIFGN